MVVVVAVVVVALNGSVGRGSVKIRRNWVLELLVLVWWYECDGVRIERDIEWKLRYLGFG